MKKWFYIKLFLFIVLLGGSLFAWPYLPEMVPSHWNIYGVPDNFWPRIFSVFFAPGIYLLMWSLFSVLPKIDPRKEKYSQFEDSWNILQLVFLVFFVYLQGIVFSYVFIPGLNFNRLMLVGLGVLFVLIGNYMGKIKQNYFIGVKTPWALNDVDNWNKTQRLGGWMFVISGLVFVLEGFLQWQLLAMLIGLIVLIVFVPFAYSYYLFRISKK
jgi:uncharacterized membrane protein